MSEELSQEQAAAVAPPVEKNPFRDSDWSSVAPTEEAVKGVPEQKVSVAPEEKEEIFDADDFLKKELGFENWDSAKTEVANLKKFKEDFKPVEPFKFANEDSEKYFNALKEGKEDDVFAHLNTKKELERAEKLDITKVADAAKLVKTAIQFKNKDLTPDEVDYLFDEKYTMPEKPEQAEDQTDDDYQKSLAGWNKKVQMAEKRLVIDAKLAKPELSKFKSELVLPDIPKAELKEAEVSQESLDKVKAIQDGYLKTFESGYKSFDNFKVSVKDESVEIPVSFKVSPEDQAELKTLAENVLFKTMDVNKYFSDRWFKEDASGNFVPNPAKIMQDLMLLEKPEKVLQGLSNDAAQKRLAHQIKLDKNINVNGNRNNTILKPDATNREKEEELIMRAG
jgi:hypothetical protein